MLRFRAALVKMVKFIKIIKFMKLVRNFKKKTLHINRRCSKKTEKGIKNLLPVKIVRFHYICAE